MVDEFYDSVMSTPKNKSNSRGSTSIFRALRLLMKSPENLQTEEIKSNFFKKRVTVSCHQFH